MEKFSIPDLSRQKLQEGLDELNAGNPLSEYGDIDEANKIIDGFCVESEDGNPPEETDWSIEYGLRNLSQAEKEFVFEVWFSRDSSVASYWINKFGKLPVHLQEAARVVKERERKDEQMACQVEDVIVGRYPDEDKLENLYRSSELERWVRALPSHVKHHHRVQLAVVEKLKKLLVSGDTQDIQFAITIRNIFKNILEDIYIQRIGESVKNEMVRLAWVNVDSAQIFFNEIRESFYLTDNLWREIALENVGLILKDADFFAAYIGRENIHTVYTNTIEKIRAGHDDEVTVNFEALEAMLGKDRMKRFLLATPAFWRNPHDYLLFMRVLGSRSAEDREQIQKIVMLPLLVPEVDIQEFRNLLSSFDVNIYIHDRGGALFHSMQDFRREVQIQKLGIRIPDGASDRFGEAIQALMAAPGIDSLFIRKIIDSYTKSTGDVKDFTGRLIEIIEGRDAIDERQCIRPWEQEIPFDPLHKVILSSVGIRGFNEQSQRLFDGLRGSAEMGQCIAVLRKKDGERIAELRNRRDELKAKYPEKSGRYDAEFRLNVKKGAMFKLASGDTPLAICIENRDTYQNSFSPEEWDELFTRFASAIQHDTELFESVSKIFLTLTNPERQEMVKSFVDVEAGFFLGEMEQIRALYESVVHERKLELTEVSDQKHRAKIRKECVDESVRRFLSEGTKRSFMEFFFYLALNNRGRIETGKKVLSAASSVLGSRQGKERYTEQAQAVGERDIVQAFLKGKLVLEEEDERQLREVYQSIMQSNSVRTLGVEIARKSDPEGWVCGNYTDCCMPFTSKKNQEYLLREDMSYFLVSRNDALGDRDIIGQSVLVYGENERMITIACDNIEIANHSVARGERAVVAKAYQSLKEHLIDIYGNKGKRLKIVIGTSYNDDGGLVTGGCELKPVDAEPLLGKMSYSDWHSHSSNYVLYDSEAEDFVQKYYGLSIDGWESSRLHGYLSRQFQDVGLRQDTERSIEDMLRKIGRGEDDGDGGLNFADNYSVALTRSDEQVGYIIAADYLTEDEQEDLIHFEDMQLQSSLSEGDKQEIFRQYLGDKKIKKLANKKRMDGVFLSERFLQNNPFALKVLQNILVDFQVEERDGGSVLRK